MDSGDCLALYLIWSYSSLISLQLLAKGLSYSIELASRNDINHAMSCCRFQPSFDLTTAFFMANNVKISNISCYFSNSSWLFNALPYGTACFIQGKILAGF
jgi:hypothetical protein